MGLHPADPTFGQSDRLSMSLGRRAPCQMGMTWSLEQTKGVREVVPKAAVLAGAWMAAVFLVAAEAMVAMLVAAALEGV